MKKLLRRLVSVSFILLIMVNCGGGSGNSNTDEKIESSKVRVTATVEEEEENNSTNVKYYHKMMRKISKVNDIVSIKLDVKSNGLDYATNSPFIKSKDVWGLDLQQYLCQK